MVRLGGKRTGDGMTEGRGGFLSLFDILSHVGRKH